MSLAYRAYFALPPELATESGTVTNAVHGFVSMLVFIVREHRPDSLAVAFDLPQPTFRDELMPQYKAGRAETPDDLLPQFEMVRDILHVLNVPVVEVPGFEADDVLATLATQARDRRCDVVIVTGDRDCFQLVEDPHVRVLYNRRGVSDYSLYDAAGIVERTGVTPDRYPMLAALRGDPSDNLPGIPGVGEKTAAKLINTYGDLDGIFANLAALSPKLRQNLAAHEASARANAVVTPLVRDVPLDVTVEELSLGGWDLAKAREAFAALELRTVWGRLVPLLAEGAFGPPIEGSELPDPVGEQVSSAAAGVASGAAAAPAPVVVVPRPLSVIRPSDEEAALAALRDLGGRRRLAVAGRWEGDTGRSPLTGLVLVAEEAGARVEGSWFELRLLEIPSVASALEKVLAAAFVAHDAKELLRSLVPLGVDARGLVMDTAVATYLLDPSSGEYSLGQAVRALGGSADDAPLASDGDRPPAQLTLGVGEEGVGEVSGAPGALAEPDPPAEAGAEADLVAQLADPLFERLDAEGLRHLHDSVELPLVRVLARMEVLGIAVDQAELRRIADELISEAARLESEVHRLAGHEFNVNSTPQLRTVLYEELKLTPGRKTKTGYSTDAATLELLREDHAVVDTLLRYREVEKLRSTYGESLLAEVAPDGRIHATFRQTVARTGRLSSERPNLHNIPVRTDAGRRFRRAFVPAPGRRFLVADYDQIELRVLAHLSGDPGLAAAFTNRTDVHRTVAAGIWGVPPEEVSRLQREQAKMVSYGLAYGMEAYGLARRLATGVEVAAEIMDRYFAAFPEVRAYMDATVAEARARGYTRTELGRKRPLPELNDRNYRVRQAAERQAMNAGIQGMAADLFKTALVRLDAALEDQGLAGRLVLQVHDEVLVEVPPDEAAAVEALTRSALVSAVELSVPLEVSMAWGDSWADAKG